MIAGATQLALLNVDDNDATRDARTRILRDAGFEVKEAATGREALQLVASDLPRLVLLDVRLPDMHGFEVCRLIKSDPATASIPILHVSASFPDSKIAAKGLDGGADAYLEEPVEPEMLVATVHALLRVHRAEEALRDAARQWQATFDAINDGVALVDGDGNILRCNKGLVRLLRMEAVHLIGRSCRDAVTGGAVGQRDCPLARMLESGRRESLDLLLYDRWLHITADPVFDAVGRLSGAVWIMADITDERRAAVEIKSRVRQQAVVAELGQLAIDGADPADLTQRAVDLVRVTLDVGLSGVLELLPDRSALLLRAGSGWKEGCVGRATMPAGANSLAAYVLLLEDPVIMRDLATESRFEVGALMREHQIVSGIAAPIMARSGSFGLLTIGSTRRREFTSHDTHFLQAIAHVLATAIERDHNKRARRALEEERASLLAREQAARAAADAANRAKDEFLATVSHELRTPVAAILGWTRILSSRKLSDAEFQEAIEVMQRNARTQVRLIEDLLDISRIISGRLRLDLKPIEIDGVVQAACDMVRPAAEAKGLRLKCSLSAAPCRVVGDPERLQQIVVNLLSNSVKFTPEGGAVDISLERASETARIIVRDTGAGIAPGLLPHIFEPFRQGSGIHQDRSSGMGLGLAIVRSLVELHGGSIRAESPGSAQGSTFIAELPLNAAGE